MRMIVGLGNPGRKYELTKHNVGFLVADLLADHFDIDISTKKENALVGEARMGGEKILLVKPQTFMNLSGQAVGALARFYQIPAENIIVVYDDLDIPLGKVRVRAKGSAGGHNGIKSLIQHLGTMEFPRVKIGIGRPDPNWQTPDYVLSPFNDEEWKNINPALTSAKDGILEILKNGTHQAMNKFNGE